MRFENPSRACGKSSINYASMRDVYVSAAMTVVNFFVTAQLQTPKQSRKKKIPSPDSEKKPI
jgi:hypothetical protein